MHAELEHTSYAPRPHHAYAGATVTPLYPDIHSAAAVRTLSVNRRDHLRLETLEPQDWLTTPPERVWFLIPRVRVPTPSHGLLQR